MLENLIADFEGWLVDRVGTKTLRADLGLNKLNLLMGEVAHQFIKPGYVSVPSAEVSKALVHRRFDFTLSIFQLLNDI